MEHVILQDDDSYYVVNYIDNESLNMGVLYSEYEEIYLIIRFTDNGKKIILTDYVDEYDFTRVK